MEETQIQSKNKISIPKDLIEAVANDKVVVFAGAGTSMSLGLPSWKDLVLKFLDVLKEYDESYMHFEILLKQGLLSPLNVLDYIHDPKGIYNNLITGTLENVFKLDNKQDFTLQNKILKLTGKIITSNYDKAFETASKEVLNVVLNDGKYNLAGVSDKKNFLFKIHGDIGSYPERCILSTNQYRQLYNENAFMLGLKILFIQKTVLFIGFSMTDPYIENILSNITEVYQNLNRKHYLITTDKDFDRIKYPYIHPLFVKNYNTDLLQLLDRLISHKAYDDINSETKSISNLRARPYNRLIGRKKQLEDILEKMSNRLPVTAIKGVSGLGKTSLALEIAYICIGKSDIKVRNPMLFEFVVWISMSEFVNAENPLNHILDEIGRATGYIKITQINKDEDKINAVNEILQTKKILIIIDNYELNENVKLEKWVQNVQEPSEVLLTTLKEPPFTHNNYPLDQLEFSEAFEFFQREAAIQGLELTDFNIENNFRPLYNAIGGIPQALILALGLIRQGALHLNEFNENRDEYTAIFEKLHTYSWNKLSINSKELLKLLPSQIVKYSIEGELLFTICEYSISEFNKVTKELCDWNLLKYNPHNQLFTIHPTLVGFILAKQTQNNISEDDIKGHFIKYYLEKVRKIITRDKPKELYWNGLVSDKMNLLQPHWNFILQALNKAAEYKKNKYLLVDFVILLVHYLDSRFYNQERMKFVTLAIEACEQLKDLEYQHALLKIDALGWTYVEENKFDKARECIKSGCEIARHSIKDKILKSELMALATAWQARTLMEDGQIIKAESLIEKLKKYKGKEWIQCRINMVIGDFFFKKGEYENSLDEYLDAKKESESYGGEGFDYQINPRLGLAYLGSRAQVKREGKAAEYLFKAEQHFLAVYKNQDIYIGKLYGEYGLALVAYERGNVEEANLTMKKVEAEIMDRSNSNLLLKLIKEYRLKK